jgi:YjbE family integral membrane protein
MSLDLASPVFWAAGLQIIVVNLLLSGDNAVVIALACRNLPEAQRKKAVFWGVFGAVGARIVLTLFAASLLGLPWLKIVGAALLVWIGVQLIAQEQDAEHDIKASSRLAAAIRTVVMADVVMSLDNVVAVAAAAQGNIVLLVFGLALSIPIVVLGSSLVMTLIRKFPWLVVAGGGLLGWIAGEMAVGDVVATNFVATRPWLEHSASYAGFVLVVLAGLALAKRTSPQRD